MIKKRILTTAVTTALASGLMVFGMASVMAASKGDTASTEDAHTRQDRIKVSEDAMMSMRDVNDARIALFNGQTDWAQTQVDAAVTRIDAAVADAEIYAIDVNKEDKDEWFVPFDTEVAMTDTYEIENPGADNDQNADKTEQRRMAADEDDIKLDDVDVSVSAGLLPVKFAQEQIDKAARLISEGDYYGANLALKAVDDAVIIQTVSVDEPPEGEPAADNAS